MTTTARHAADGNEKGRGDREHVRLIGRESELWVLMEALERGTPVIVTGPWGSGKSALVENAVRMMELAESTEWVSFQRYTDLDALFKDLEAAVGEGRTVILDDLDRVNPEVAQEIARFANTSDGRFILITSDASPLAPYVGPFRYLQLAGLSFMDTEVLLREELALANIILSDDEIVEIAKDLIRETGGNVRSLQQKVYMLTQRGSGLAHADSRLFLTLNLAALDTDLTVDLLTALNEVYRALGGEGLEIEDGELREFQMKGALV